MAFRSNLGSMGHSRRLWPVLLLVLIAVLVPTAGLLWFMSQAVNQQRDVARQRLSEAYRSQLVLLRDHLDSYWEKRAASLAIHSEPAAAPAVFQQLVKSGLADSIIYLAPEGSVAYPQPIERPALPLNGFFVRSTIDPDENSPAWTEAQAFESRRETLPSAAVAYARIATSEKDDFLAGRAVQAQVRCLVQSGDKESAL